jgi:hypothetical protein
MAKPTSRHHAGPTILGALLVTCATAIGCGDANKAPGPDSAASAPTGAPAPSAQTGSAGPAPTTSAPPIKAEQPSSPGGAASGAPAGGPYERASLLAYLPTECPEGRAYVDVQKMLGGDGGAVKDLVEKLVSTTSKDKAKGEAVLAELRKGGLDPAVSVREIAACVLAGRQPLVVFGIDTSKSKDATQTLFEAISAGEGKDKVTLVDEGGMKVIKNPRGELMAMVAPNVLVLAKSVDRLKEAAKAPGGTAGFADAPAHVLWMRLRGREDVDVSVAEKGKDYEMTALFPPSGPMVAKLKSDPKGVAEAYESEAQKRAKQIEGSPLKNLASAVKAAKWSVDGDRVKVAATSPQSVVVETIKVVLATPEQQLMGAFR